MQEKRIGKRLVLLSWDRYQQLLAAERNARIKDRARELLKKYEAHKAVGSK